MMSTKHFFSYDTYISVAFIYMYVTVLTSYLSLSLCIFLRLKHFKQSAAYMGFLMHPECQKQTALATYGPNSGFQKIFRRSSRRYGVHQVVVLSNRALS